ncbi:MAG TPA: aldose epimerase, partial [Micrococcus luteus]|nr:aldose epimerase [Micrococcus luteus]
PTAELSLRVPADAWIRTGEDLIPVETLPVDGTDLDFRRGRAVGEAALDVCLTGLTPDADGRHRQTLLAADGRAVTLWSDHAFAYTHVFVTDRLPGRDTALAVEPLTAPADALNSGEGLHR